MNPLVLQARELAAQGMTHEQIGAALGLARSTVSYWNQTHGGIPGGRPGRMGPRPRKRVPVIGVHNLPMMPR